MVNNNFEIRHAGRVIRRHNSVRNVFDFYRTHRKMCSFIYAYMGEVRYYFGAPTLVASNFDPGRGRLFATYQLEISADELGGETIVRVGFASSQSPDLVVNDCEVGIVKQAGEPLVITGTLYLDCTSDSLGNTYLSGFGEGAGLGEGAGESAGEGAGESAGEGGGIMQTRGEVVAKLLPGDNRLVRMLLGTESMGSALFRMTYGTDNTPQSAFTYEETYPSVAALPVMTDSSIEFSGTFPSATDAVLLYDGEAVLRFMPALMKIKSNLAVTATENDSITLAANGLVTGIEDVKISYTSVSDYTVTRLPSSLILVRTENEKLPASAVLKSDTSGRYFAFVNEGRGAFFSLGAEGLSITGFFEGQDVMLCEDGGAFIVKDSGYIPDFRAVAAAKAVGISLSTGGLADLTGEGEGASGLSESLRSDGLPIVFCKDGREIPLGLRAGERYAAAYSDVKSDDVDGSGGDGGDTASRGGYVLNLLKNNDLITYMFDSDFVCSSAVIKDFSSYAAEGARLFSVPGAVCAVSNTHAPVAYDKNGINALRVYWLSAICSSEWFAADTNPIYDSGRLLLYDSYFDRTNYFADMGTREVIAAAYGRHYGELCVRNKGLSVDITRIGETSKLLTVMGSVTFARAIGRFLYLFFADGSVRAYYIGFSSVRLRSGRITMGFPVSLILEKVMPKSGKFCIRISRN